MGNTKVEKKNKKHKSQRAVVFSRTLSPHSSLCSTQLPLHSILLILKDTHSQRTHISPNVVHFREIDPSVAPTANGLQRRPACSRVNGPGNQDTMPNELLCIPTSASSLTCIYLHSYKAARHSQCLKCYHRPADCHARCRFQV